MASGENKKVNKIAEFKDSGLEKQYFEDEMRKSMRYLRIIILVFGIVYAAISIYEYSYNEDKLVFLRSTVSRLVVLGVAVVFFLTVKKIKSPKRISIFISAFELVAFLAYIYLLAQQQAQGFMEQVGAIIILIMAIALIPNRWVYLMVVSCMIAVCYLLASPTYIRDIDPYIYAEAVIYMAITVTVSGISQYRLNYYKRQRYFEAQQLKRLSVTDRLTGLNNRNMIDDVLSRYCRIGEPFALILFDIDDFKNINDTFGHLEGDKVLQDVTHVVTRNIRANDLFARWGGEEFLILTPDHGEMRAYDFAERIRRQIESQVYGSGGISLTCSFGVTEYRSGESPVDMMRRVDNLLYESKRAGKNRVSTDIVSGR